MVMRKEDLLWLMIVCIALVFLAGCADPIPQDKQIKTTNPQYQVDLLFKINGCDMYRFIDGQHIWFLMCPNNQPKTVWQENCGKGCIRQNGVETK